MMDIFSPGKGVLNIDTIPKRNSGHFRLTEKINPNGVQNEKGLGKTTCMCRELPQVWEGLAE
jgi:hypothetical protein